MIKTLLQRRKELKNVKEHKLISIVILSFNKLEYTRICLSSLLKSSYPEFEIIVVDNGSTDGSVEWLRDFQQTAARSGCQMKLICNRSNVGCSTARNQGIDEANGEFVVFCDNDIALCSASWLEKMSSLLMEKDSNGMVGPKIIYPFEPFAIQCAGVAVSPSGRIQFRGRGASRFESAFNFMAEVQALISACCMVKMSVLEQVGGFDEVYNPVEFEDIDLCYRVREAGYSVWYQHDVEMYHFENVTTEGSPSLPNTYLIVKNGMVFKQRWRRMFAVENGPDDSDCRWNKDIKTRKLAEIGDLPII